MGEVQPKMIVFWPKVVCPVADGDDVIFDVASSDMDRVAEKSKNENIDTREIYAQKLSL